MSAPRRILVTGAGGFVGKPLLAALRSTFPDAMLVAGRRSGETCPGADEEHAFDLLSVDSIRALVAAARPDACIHLAALSAVSESFKNPDTVWHANVEGTRALAAALMAEVPGCKVLHASSAEVYGLSFQSGQPLGEGAVLQPTNPYAAAKAAIDIALGEMALRGLRVVRLRPANHTGPGQTARFALPSFAQQVARIEAGLQEPIIHTGALDRWRDFMDVRDVCRAYTLSLEAADRLPTGAVFNLASGTSREIASILDDLLRLAGVEARIATRADALRPSDLQRAEVSARAAKDALGWAPSVPWEETLTELLEYWRAVVREEAGG
jgi:GDP-4-dehydro-6-deoxy-D-mannose reductase